MPNPNPRPNPKQNQNSEEQQKRIAQEIIRQNHLLVKALAYRINLDTYFCLMQIEPRDRQAVRSFVDYTLSLYE